MEKMLRFTKYVLSVLFICAIVFAVKPLEESHAAGSSKITNSEAKSLLSEKIKNKYCQYAYVDIDKDGVNELIVKQYSGKFTCGDDIKTLYIYKVVDGKVKAILKETESAGSFYLPTDIDIEVYSSDKIFVKVVHLEEGEGSECIYKYNGKKFKKTAEVFFEEGQIGRCTVNGKNATYEKYESYVRKNLKKQMSITLKQNGAKTSKKYNRKKLNSTLDYIIERDDLNASYIEYVYDDINGDGREEMIFKGGEYPVEIIFDSGSETLREVDYWGYDWMGYCADKKMIVFVDYLRYEGSINTYYRITWDYGWDFVYEGTDGGEEESTSTWADSMNFSTWIAYK